MVHNGIGCTLVCVTTGCPDTVHRMALECIPVYESSWWGVLCASVAEHGVPTAAVVGDVEEEDGVHVPTGPIHTPLLHSILWDDTVPSSEHGMPSVRFAWPVTSCMFAWVAC